MAKKVHAYSLKGTFDLKSMTIGEYDKKSETTTYYSLQDILTGFDGKEISWTVKEEDGVPAVDAPDSDDEE